MDSNRLKLKKVVVSAAAVCLLLAAAALVPAGRTAAADSGRQAAAESQRSDRAADVPRQGQQPGPVRLTPAALELHRSCVVVDGHNDLPWELRRKGTPTFEKFDIGKLQKTVHTDIPRLRAGGVGAQFWSVWVPPETARKGTALKQTLEQIALVDAMIAHYPAVFEKARSADDIQRIHAAGRIASLIGVEGGYSIEGSLDVLRRLYDLGARYMTLTHNDTIAWADSATDQARHGGLTPFGEKVVREMNRLGMLVDLAHVSDETMKDALRVSRAPVIFSHSSARAIADHPRNVPDDVLRRTAENNGVVMVNFYSGFVVPEAARISTKWYEVARKLRAELPDQRDYRNAIRRWEARNPCPRGTIHQVVDHIDHIVRVAGIDHVGLGSDFDGVERLPTQLEDVSCYPYLTQALMDRGYTGGQIRKILGDNLLRALRTAENVARELQSRHGESDYSD